MGVERMDARLEGREEGRKKYDHHHHPSTKKLGL